jgi:type IV pilus assembly protein PilV
MFKEIKNQQGMTLVEVLVALTVFAVGLLAIASMQVTAIRANSSSNIQSTAVAAGQGVLEDLIARDKSDAVFAAPGPNTGTIPVSVNDGSAALIYNANYTVTLDTPIADLARIDVQVISSWDGTQRSTLSGLKRID